jgi:hypothetical protein
MDATTTIRVLKRDGSIEAFNSWKLTAAMWRGLRCRPNTHTHARQLAEAIGIYLARRESGAVSSRAIFEMATKAFRHVGLARAARRMEKHLAWRCEARRKVRIRHDGRVTFWDKGWLCQLTCRSWHIGTPAARIIVGRLEAEILRSGRGELSREEIMDMLNRSMVDYGLADAVPVRQ